MSLQSTAGSEKNSTSLELIQQLGPARLWHTGRLRVIELQGSPKDMGRQHGELLQADIKQGMVPRIQQRLHPKGMNFLLRGALDLGSRWLYNRILKDIPSELREEMQGIAEGSGQDFNDVLRASYFSEFAQLSLSLIGSQYFRRRAQAAGACTSAVSMASPMSDASRQRAPLLHGKNQDYEGAGYWDACPTLIICRPDQGYAYAKTTSAGILKGNLSTNEHGISISGHFLFSYKTRKRGQAFTTLENRIMRQARSLDDALEIIRGNPCLGSFAFVISDSNSNQAVCVEIDGTEVSVRQATDNTLAMANNYGASEQQIHNDMLLASCSARNPVARRRRMEELMEKLNSAPQLQDIIDCLSDHFDVCSDSPRALGNVIAQTTTVTSGVAIGEEKQLWMAENTVPVPHGDYVGFALAGAFAGSEPPKLLGRRGASKPLSSDRQAAARLYCRAQNAFENSPTDIDNCIRRLQHAIDLDPNEPAYRRILARLLIRQGHYDQADEHLQLASLLPQNNNEKRENQLLQGHLFDLTQQRSDALQCYEEIVTAPMGTDPTRAINPKLQDLARKFAKSPFREKHARKLPVPFTFMSGIE